MRLPFLTRFLSMPVTTATMSETTIGARQAAGGGPVRVFEP